MGAADVSRRLVEAVDARDWAAAGAILDAGTVVTDHRELPFEGTGADVLGVWRRTFDANDGARARCEVLDDDGDRATVTMGFGDSGGELVVRVVVRVQDGRMTRFDCYAR